MAFLSHKLESKDIEDEPATMNHELPLRFLVPVPLIGNNANNEQGNKCQVNNATIHAAGRAFAQLLSSFCTNRALRPAINGKCK